MDYTLEFNSKGNLDGFQKIHEVVGGFKVWESQYFFDGDFGMGSVSVDCGNQVYQFMDSDWGTMENCRNASIAWMDEKTTFVYDVSSVTFYTHIIVKPMNEEAFILHA